MYPNPPLPLVAKEKCPLPLRLKVGGGVLRVPCGGLVRKPMRGWGFLVALVASSFLPTWRTAASSRLIDWSIDIWAKIDALGEVFGGIG